MDPRFPSHPDKDYLLKEDKHSRREEKNSSKNPIHQAAKRVMKPEEWDQTTTDLSSRSASPGKEPPLSPALEALGQEELSLESLTLKSNTQQESFERLKERAKTDILSTLYDFKSYNITDKTLIESAILLLSKDPEMGRCITNFGPLNSTVAYESASIWIKMIPLTSYDTSKYYLGSLENFNIVDNEKEFKLAKLLVGRLNPYSEIETSYFKTLTESQIKELVNSLATRLRISPVEALAILNVKDKSIITDIMLTAATGPDYHAVIRHINRFVKILDEGVVHELALKVVSRGGDAESIVHYFNIKDKNLIFKILKICIYHRPSETICSNHFRTLEDDQKKELFDLYASIDWKNAFLALKHIQFSSISSSDPYVYNHILNFAQKGRNVFDYAEYTQYNFTPEQNFELYKELVEFHAEDILPKIDNLTAEQEESLIRIAAKFDARAVVKNIQNFTKISAATKFEIAKFIVSNSRHDEKMMIFGKVDISIIIEKFKITDLSDIYEIFKFSTLSDPDSVIRNIGKYNFSNSQLEELFLIMAARNGMRVAKAMQPSLLKNPQSRAKVFASCIEQDFMSARYANTFTGDKADFFSFIDFLPPTLENFFNYTSLTERTNLEIYQAALHFGTYTDKNLVFVLLYPQNFNLPENIVSNGHDKLRFTSDDDVTHLNIARLALQHDLPSLLSKCKINKEDAPRFLLSEMLVKNSFKCLPILFKMLDKEEAIKSLTDRVDWKKHFSSPNNFIDILKNEVFQFGSSFSNHKVKSLRFEGTMVEKFFFDPTTREFALELIEKCEGVITPRLARIMIRDCRAGLNPEYRELLLSRKAATPADLERIEVSDINSLEGRILESCRYLEVIGPLYNLNPNRADLNRIFSIKMLKKEAKFLKDHIPQNADEKALKEAYELLSSRYDSFVNNHLFLSELRLISKEIRLHSQQTINANIISERLVKFYSLWGYDAVKRTAALANIQNLFKEARKDMWQDMASRATAAAHRASKEMLLNDREISWAHATVSRVIPSLQKTHALIPTGMLQGEGIVPITGEVSGTQEGLNRTKLSGEVLTKHWVHDAENMYMDSTTRLLVCLQYGTSEEGYYSQGLRFDPEEALQWVSRQIDLHHFDQQETRTFCIQILRLRMTLPDADARLAPYKEKIESLNLFSSNVGVLLGVANFDYHTKDKLLGAFTSKIAFTYTPEELKQVLDPNPYPIIFASLTADPEGFSHPGYQTPNAEYVVEGKQFLGKDIQIAFTKAENVKELSANLKPYGIQVYDLEMAFYLETMSMIKGTQNMEMGKNLLDGQTKINTIMQRDILTKYTTPFPEQPSYTTSKGEVKFVERPFYGIAGVDYDSYREAVEQGEMLPRTIHGAMHATRVAIWSQMLANMFAKLDVPRLGAEEITDRFSLAIATALHDSGREDDGYDHWDEKSAQLLRNYIITRNLDFPEREKWIHALSEKDPAHDEFTSDIQRIVHDADCLEIMRVLGRPDEFMRDRLAIMQLRGLSPAQKDEINKMIDEVSRFITMTEEREIKHKLEEESSDYYLDVMLLVTPEAFPTLHRLLAYEIAEASKAKSSKQNAEDEISEAAAAAATPMAVDL